MRHVFVSYCHEDSAFARLLEEQIGQNGFGAWRDHALRAGDDWRLEIDTAIRESLAAIVVLSPASIRSAYVNYEWAFARGSGIPVVSILLKAGGAVLDQRLAAQTILDFTEPGAGPWDALIQRLRDLQDALRPTTVQAPRDAPAPIQQAVRELDSLDSERRREAIASLGQTDHPAIVEILAEAARHPLQDVRLGAAIQLGARKDPRAIPAILEGLRHGRCERALLCTASEEIGEAAVPALLEAMQDPSVRDPVYWSLGLIDNAPALAALVDHAADPDAQIRSLAASALSGHPAGIPALLELARDPDRDVRNSALHALTKCVAKAGGHEAVFPAFLQALNDEYDQVVIAACLGLEQWCDPRALLHLLDTALTHPSEQVRIFAKRALVATGGPPPAALRQAALSPEPAFRERAIGLLGELGNECDVALFVDATRDPDSKVRQNATNALGGKHAKSAVPVLLQLLRGDDPEVVWRAAISLGKIGDPSAVPALIDCLEDTWWRIPRSAIIALEDISDPRAVPPLIACLKNDDDDTSARAASALEKIGTREARAALKTWKRQRVE